MAAPRHARPRSLFLRLVLGFVLPAAAIWVALAAWVVFNGMLSGQRGLEKELADYSRQVLAVAHTFRHDPVRLAQAIRQVEGLDNEASRVEAGAADRLRIQIWLDGRLLQPVADLPPELPVTTTPAYRELAPEADREARWGSFVQTDGEGVTVRVAVRNTARIALLWPGIGLVVAPLLVSLPLLLIPAWFMTRKGLRPLDTLVREIAQRAASGELTRLPPAGYRELQPVIEAMNRLLDRLEGQLQRERAFVADVAHEMKTPLAILRSNLDTVRDSRDPVRRETARRDLHTGLERASHLIGQLLRMARLDADRLPDQVRAVDLAELVRERVAALVPLADARAQVLEVDMPETLVGLHDVDAVGAIVDNLVDNAIKYADPDSVIRVRLQGPQPDGEIVLSVLDQGPGIDPALHGVALTRFGRAGRQDGAGAGLGLSIVQRAALRLGGALTLGTPPGGGGLCAEVRFPAAVQKAAA